MSDKLVLLGNKIKQIRKQKGITQEKLAELVDRSKNHISKIELGATNPPVSLIFDIADKLNVEPNILFQFNDAYYSPDFDCTCNDIPKVVDKIISDKIKKLLTVLTAD